MQQILLSFIFDIERFWLKKKVVSNISSSSCVTAVQLGYNWKHEDEALRNQVVSRWINL